MTNTSVLPRNLRPLVQSNYNWIISHGGDKSEAATRTSDLHHILHAIVAFKYTDVHRHIQIKRELGESAQSLNARIMRIREFAKFLQQENYSVDIELLTYPVFKV